MNTDIANPRTARMREIQQKIFWGTLSVVGIVILFAAFILLCCGGCSKKNELEKTVSSALRLKTGGDRPLKIIEISEADSVFYNRMCPEEEVMELSEKFLDFSMNIMQESQTEMLKDSNDAYRCKMDRYSATSAALSSLNAMLERPTGKHCGWRVKTRYQTVDDSGTPYVAETWLIFDKRKQHILNSFDICIL